MNTGNCRIGAKKNTLIVCAEKGTICIDSLLVLSSATMFVYCTRQLRIVTDRLTPEQRRKTMQAIRGKDTSIELILRKELWKRGIRYRKNCKNVYGHPDIAFIGKNILVLLNGNCQQLTEVNRHDKSVCSQIILFRLYLHSRIWKITWPYWYQRMKDRHHSTGSSIFQSHSDTA